MSVYTTTLFTLTLILVSIVGTQIIYLLVLLYGITKSDPHPVQPPHGVSVIICAHDEEENLRELVPMLLNQDHPDYEIIVVEDRCNDGTFDYLREATQHHARLKLVRVIHKPDHITGKKFALTLGIKAARYDWVLLTDADCRPASNQWIKHMTERYDPYTQLVLGFSPYAKRPGWLNAFIRFESLLTGIQFMSWAKLGIPYMGVGRNLCYKKSLFLENKGFHRHQEIAGGDDDLFVNRHAARLNTAVVMGKESITISRPKLTWREFFHQKLRHLSVGKHYRFSDKWLLGIFTSTWILAWFSLPAYVFSPFTFILLIAFGLRLILMVFLMWKGAQRLGGSIEVWKVPVLDIIFAFYYLVTGLRALVVKRIKWKK